MAKPSARESTITRAILRELNKLPNCRAVKLHGSAYSNAGEPDIYGCISGRMFVIEVKRPSENPTRLQEWTLNQWSRAGACAITARSVQDALGAVRALVDTIA